MNQVQTVWSSYHADTYSTEAPRSNTFRAPDPQVHRTRTYCHPWVSAPYGWDCIRNGIRGRFFHYIEGNEHSWVEESFHMMIVTDQRDRSECRRIMTERTEMLVARSGNVPSVQRLNPRIIVRRP